MGKSEDLKLKEDFDRDASWIDEHSEELIEKYAGKYIAVHKEKVVGADYNLQNLLKGLEEKEIESAVIPIVSDESVDYIL